MSLLGAASRLVTVPPAGSYPNYVGDYDNGADYGIGDVVSTPAGSPYGSAGQLFIRVSNPNNPGYPPGTASWETAYDLNVFVSGAGSSEVNGLYLEAGEFGGKKFYNLQSGGYVIAWDSVYENQWVLRSTSGVTVYKTNDDDGTAGASFPWESTTWGAASGTAPVPTLSSVAPPLDATAMYRGSTKIWPVVDLDAQDYINRVQAADSAALGGTQTLEEGVKNAINDFVIGCKKDGIWGKISTSAIFCGARSLQGALNRLTIDSFVSPLVSYGFVQSDYSRTLGIQGASNQAAGKYIDTRFNVAYTRFGQFPDDSVHAAAYVGHTHDGVIMGSGTGAGIAEIGLRPFNTQATFFRVRDSRATITDFGPFSAGFVMGDRQNQLSTVYSQHSGQTFVTTSGVDLKPYSTTILDNTVWLFRRNTTGATATAGQFNGRILYFSIGRSIVLANTPRYVMTGTSLQDIDGNGFNGQYITSGSGLLLYDPTNNPNTTITLEPYDPVTNAKRYVVRGYMQTANGGWENRIAYVSMHSEPSTSSGTISPVGHYQRVTVRNTSLPAAVTTESPYLQADLQLLTVKYKARVDALIAGIQGSIV